VAKWHHEVDERYIQWHKIMARDKSLASASSKGSSFTESPIFIMAQHISHKDKGITRAYADIKLTVTNAEEEGDVTDHARGAIDDLQTER